MNTEPPWLRWARDLQALAQSGLAFSPNVFDRERFEAVRMIAAAMMAAGSGAPQTMIEDLFAGQTGYATPKIDVRGAAFDDRGRILMVRETLDHGRWTLPGGWADVNLTPAENAAKEMVEESGFTVAVTKLAAVWDRSAQGHPGGPFSCAKFFFLCDITGGEATTSIETSEIGFFAEHDLPEDVSLGRVLPAQLRRMFAHHKNRALPTDFE